MKINYKIVAGVLCAVVVYDEIAGYINLKRHKKLAKLYALYKEHATYLAKRLDAHGIPVDDFDVIVYNNFLENVKNA